VPPLPLNIPSLRPTATPGSKIICVSDLTTIESSQAQCRLGRLHQLPLRTKASPSHSLPLFRAGVCQGSAQEDSPWVPATNFMLDLISYPPQDCISTSVLLHPSCREHIHSLPFYFIRAFHHHEQALAIWLYSQASPSRSLLLSQDNFDSLAIPQCGFHLCTTFDPIPARQF